MASSALHPHAVASTVLLATGLIGGTLAALPANPSTPVQAWAVRLTSGDPAADLPTDVSVDIQQTVTNAEGELSDAASLFGSNDVYAGLNSELAGLDSLLLGTQDDLLVEGYNYLTGAPDNGYYFFPPLEFPPGDLSAGVVDAQDALAGAQAEFTAFFTDLAANHVANALGDLASGTNDALGLAPDELILGLAGSLLAP